MSAYIVTLRMRFNSRRIAIDPQDAKVSEQAGVLEANGARLRVSKSMYPQVEKAADRLKWARRQLLASVGALGFGDGAFLVQESRLEELRESLEELKDQFLREAEALKEGLDDAREEYRSQVISAVCDCGMGLDYAVKRWDEYYSHQFYQESDFDPGRFGVSIHYQKLDLDSPTAPDAVQEAVYSLTAEIDDLESRVSELVGKDPANTRLRPQSRLAEVREAQEQLQWLEELLQAKQGALQARLQSLAQQLQDFQARA